MRGVGWVSPALSASLVQGTVCLCHVVALLRAEVRQGKSHVGCLLQVKWSKENHWRAPSRVEMTRLLFKRTSLVPRVEEAI